MLLWKAMVSSHKLTRSNQSQQETHILEYAGPIASRSSVREDNMRASKYSTARSPSAEIETRTSRRSTLLCSRTSTPDSTNLSTIVEADGDETRVALAISFRVILLWSRTVVSIVNWVGVSSAERP